MRKIKFLFAFLFVFSFFFVSCDSFQEHNHSFYNGSSYTVVFSIPSYEVTKTLDPGEAFEFTMYNDNEIKIVNNIPVKINYHNGYDYYFMDLELDNYNYEILNDNVNEIQCTIENKFFSITENILPGEKKNITIKGSSRYSPKFCAYIIQNKEVSNFKAPFETSINDTLYSIYVYN